MTTEPKETAMTDTATDLPDPATFRQSPDAMVWAEAFAAYVTSGLDPTDTGWTVGWFANAMAAAEFAAARPVAAQERDDRAELMAAVVRAAGRIDKALALHQSDERGLCTMCWDYPAWPCPTVRALTGGE